MLMAKIIKAPSIIKAAGNKEKKIEEFFGRVNSNTSEASIARMTSPEGWIEQGQCVFLPSHLAWITGITEIKLH